MASPNSMTMVSITIAHVRPISFRVCMVLSLVNCPIVACSAFVASLPDDSPTAM
jgi:hypothetical protein